jgi:hypothetical protein
MLADRKAAAHIGKSHDQAINKYRHTPDIKLAVARRAGFGPVQIGQLRLLWQLGRLWRIQLWLPHGQRCKALDLYEQLQKVSDASGVHEVGQIVTMSCGWLVHMLPAW